MAEPRFMTIADVAEVLATSQAQVRALISRRELRAMQLGGRNQWRVQITDLEAYIEEQYRRADEQAGPAPRVAAEGQSRGD